MLVTVTIETLLMTDDVSGRYVWDSKDIYIRLGGTVKVCLPLVSRGDTNLFGTCFGQGWRPRPNQLRTGLTRKRVERVRVRLRSRRSVQEFMPLKSWDQEFQ